MADKKQNILTILRFGKQKDMSYGELMHSKADNEELKRLGWMPKYSIEDGIRKVVETNNSSISSEIVNKNRQILEQ